MEKPPRIWIADGHNLIFKFPHLEELQTTDQRRKARQGLEEMLFAFAHRVREKVIVIYGLLNLIQWEMNSGI